MPLQLVEEENKEGNFVSTEVVKEAKLEEEPRQCTKKEKLGHAIGVLGHDSMYTLWSTWTTPFLTDILKLPAGFLAFLFGGARFFDAFTDISMGIIADRTRSKWGRFRRGFSAQVLLWGSV